MGTNGTPSTNEMQRRRQGCLLLVESDAELRRAVILCLRENGWRILPAMNPEDACRILTQETPEILMMDMDPPADRQGLLIEKFREGRADGRRGSVLIATEQRLEDGWRHKYHPDAVIFKPFDIRYLSRRISQLAEETAE
jgi:DNA-binding response OmpR family regulator